MSLNRKPTFLDSQIEPAQSPSTGRILSRISSPDFARLSPVLLLTLFMEMMQSVTASPPNRLQYLDRTNGAQLQLVPLTSRFTLTDLSYAVAQYCPSLTSSDVMTAFDRVAANFCQDNPSVDTLELSVQFGAQVSQYAKDCLTNLMDQMCLATGDNQDSNTNWPRVVIVLAIVLTVLMCCVAVTSCARRRRENLQSDNYAAMPANPPSYVASAGASAIPSAVVVTPSVPYVPAPPVILDIHDDYHHHHHHHNTSASHASGWHAPASSVSLSSHASGWRAPSPSVHASGWHAPAPSAPHVTTSSHHDTPSMPHGSHSGWH